MRRLLLRILPVVMVIGIVAVVSVQSGPDTDDVPAQKMQGTYVALGDSVSAGVGLAHDSDSSACNRTDEAYPIVLARQIRMSVSNLSCSGATIESGIGGKQDVNNLFVDAQLEQLDMLPPPSLVTLTIGANDAKWLDYIGRCYSADCTDPVLYSQFSASLAQTQQSLRQLLSDLRGRLPAKTTVVVTSYYQLFSAEMRPACLDTKGVTSSELTVLRQGQDALTAMIKQSTPPGVKYVSVDFSGHELCSNVSWVQGIGDKQPYHPTATGQQAIASAIKAAVRNTK